MCCHFVILRVLELRCLRLTKGEAGSVSCRAPPSEAADRHAFGARHTGRSSDSWAPCFSYRTSLPRCGTQCVVRLSFPLTAAGQSRSHTRFPLTTTQHHTAPNK